jgi:dolichol-phosphate mannosyltransferase
MEWDASIILCTVDEIDNLPILVKRIEEIADFRYQLVFVDDGSKDGTREFIKDYCEKHKNTKHLFSEFKRTTLVAEYVGFKNSAGKYLIKLDADLQHPPEKIKEIYRELQQGNDIVIASRYLNANSGARRAPIRGVVSRVAQMLSLMTLRYARKSTDPLSGYFGMISGLALPIEEKWRGYKILLFILSANPDARVSDVPYEFKERTKGKSKIVSGFSYVKTYLTELFLAKRIEVRIRSKMRREKS